MKSRYNSLDYIFKFLFIVLFSGITLFCGCHSEQSNQNLTKMESNTPPKVELAPGDNIEVQFYYTPELDDSQVVRPDGKISLQLIGDIEVAGKSPSELRDDLLKLYADQLKNPEINVVVRSLHNRLVYVGGQVLKPGTVEMPGQMSLMEAIIQAGGLNYQQAEVKNIVVIRHKDNKRYAYSVNLEPVLKGEETEQFILEPKDIVYVAQTKIVKVNQWVDQHINKLIPQTGFFFSRNYDRTFVGFTNSMSY